MYSSLLVYFGVALASCLLLTFFARQLGQRLHIYDVPDARRANKRIVPRLGGVPIALSFLTAIGLIFYTTNTVAIEANVFRLLPLLIGAVIVWLTGLWDDVYCMRARYKLVLQMAAALIMCLAGLQIHIIEFPFFGSLDLGDYSVPFTVLWVVGVMNAINLIDGVDGLCSGIVLSALVGTTILAIICGSSFSVVICCALAGSLVGFLVFNTSPASIFLGDAGAYFLGFIIATLPIFIITENSSTNVFHIEYVLFLAIPLLDTVLAISRRLIMGLPIMLPDRGHLHHRLLDQGYSHGKTMLSIVSFSLILSLAGVMLIFKDKFLVVAVFLVAVAAVYFLLRLCGITSFRKSELYSASTAASNSKTLLLCKYIPTLISDMNSAANWSLAKKYLDAFTANTGMSSARITLCKSYGENVVWSWSTTLPKGRRVLQLCKTYNIYCANNCFKVYFCWNSEQDHLPNDIDALLNVASQVIGNSLGHTFLWQNTSAQILSRMSFPKEARVANG
jgi:UDP-GlcNAc:undecaprenyl-phosphate GlcNAc-1-phosphate transferase